MKLFTLKNLAIFQLILFIVYNLQGTLYPSGGIVSQSILLFVIIIGGIFFVKSLLLKKKDGFYITWTIFLIINSLYFISYFLNGNVTYFNMFKSVLVCMIGFYPFYFLGRLGNRFDKQFLWLLFVNIIVTIIEFYNNKQSILSDMLTQSENVVNNIAYNFVSLIPFLFFIKKSFFLKVGCLFLIIFFIIQGAKRGAILVGGVGTIIYLYYFLKENPIRGIMKSVFLICAIVGMAYFAYDMYIENEYLIQRMGGLLEGNSSGRDYIYKRIFDSWYNSNSALTIFFGYGFAGSTILTGGLFAHNDWLEALSNFGLLGLLCYLLLFINLAKIIFLKELNFKSRMLLLTLVGIWFMTSLFSMWYTSINAFTQSVLIGYIIGYEANYKKQNGVNVLRSKKYCVSQKF